MKRLTQVEFKGDTLVLRYKDDADEGIEERAIIVKWKDHPPVVNLMKAFMEVVGGYFLSDNKGLTGVTQLELEDLFKKLLQEPPVPPTSGEGC